MDLVVTFHDEVAKILSIFSIEIVFETLKTIVSGKLNDIIALRAP